VEIQPVRRERWVSTATKINARPSARWSSPIRTRSVNPNAAPSQATAEGCLEDLVEFLLADATRQADGTFRYRTHSLYRAAAAALDDGAQVLPLRPPRPYACTHDQLHSHQMRL